MTRRREVRSVAALAREVSGLVARGFPEAVWVRGEVSGYRPNRNGHVFFDLVDHDDPPHKFPCVIWRTNRLGIDAFLRRHGVALRDGVEVEICGRVEHAARLGRVQLNVTGIDAELLAGQQALARDRLLRQLRQEGLAEANARLPVPLAPLRLGLVTAGESAAFADIRSVLMASGLSFEVLHRDAVVQGPTAPQSISRALQQCLRAGVDLVLLSRGGGSRADLAAFDSPEVARAIATAPVPIWAGVGHDIDRSVADEVAHSSFPTPTALAQAVVDKVRAALQAAELSWSRIEAVARQRVDENQQLLAFQARAAASAVREGLAHDSQRLALAADRLSRTPSATLSRLAAHSRESQRALHRLALSAAQTQLTRIDIRRATLLGSSRSATERAARRLEIAQIVCHQADPARWSRRGWTFATVEGRVVRSVDDVTIGAKLRTHLVDGWVESDVREANPNPIEATAP